MSRFAKEDRLAIIIEHGSRTFLAAPLINIDGRPKKGVMVDVSNMLPGEGQVDALDGCKIIGYGRRGNPVEVRYEKDPLGRTIDGRPVQLQVIQCALLGPMSVIPNVYLPLWGRKEESVIQDTSLEATLREAAEEVQRPKPKNEQETAKNWYSITAGIRQDADGESSFLRYSEAVVGLKRATSENRLADVAVTSKKAPKNLASSPVDDNWMTMFREVKGKKYRPVRIYAQPYRTSEALTLGMSGDQAEKASTPQKVALYAEILPVTDDRGREIKQGSFCQIDRLPDDPRKIVAPFGGSSPKIVCIGRTKKSRVYRLYGDDSSRFVWVDQGFKTMVQGDLACDIIEVPVVDGLLDVSKAQYRASNYREAAPPKEPQKPVTLLDKAGIKALVTEAKAAVAEAEKLSPSEAATKAVNDAKVAAAKAAEAAKELETLRKQITTTTKKVAEALDAGAKDAAEQELVRLTSAAGKKQNLVQRCVQAAKSAVPSEQASC